MLRSIRMSCAAAAILGGCAAASAADGFWDIGQLPAAVLAKAPSASPALLQLRAGFATFPDRLVVKARGAALPNDWPRLTSDVASATTTEAPARVLEQPVVPVAKGPTVLDGLAFEAALTGVLERGPPTPAYRPFWAKIAEVYRGRWKQPLWRARGEWTPGAQAVVARLAHTRDDALSLPAIAPVVLNDGAPAALAEQDIALTAAAVAYARQAAGDRVDPAAVSKLITARPSLPDTAAVIADLVRAGDKAGDVLAASNPPHPAYRALREKLAELRQAGTPAVSEHIPAGPQLQVGMRDDRVKLIRARFGLDINAPQSADEVLYDTRVASAVADFQRDNGLRPNGILTPRTVALLSGGQPGKLENAIIANMERWRWMPRDLGRDRIEVDVPNYTLSLVRDGDVVHRARVIVGKPTSPTPIFSNTMKFIIVNPAWHIPPSILEKEILPKLAADPDYVTRLGYEMTVRNGKISVRQPPGERNALGRIKFMFPNEHYVYLHDTPNRSLFGSARRALSHGCVRVDDPMALAAAVLRGPWSAAKVKAMVGGDEKQLNLPTPLPIHIEYFTASVGADGRLQLRDDLYGYDAGVTRALALKN